MQTAKTVVRNAAHGTSFETRIFFDCGSQRSFITADLSNKVHLTPIGGRDTFDVHFWNEGDERFS